MRILFLSITRRTIAFAFILLISFQNIIGCRDVTRDPDAYIIEGIMHFTDLEGGCWQFLDGNNQSYEIVGRDIEEINIDGQYAKLIVRDYQQAASICMVGKIVELVEIIETKQP